ncbi:MAG: hypothetical protein GY711_10770 [bacterium]|nr:hypothetical protein [bacterium]
MPGGQPGGLRGGRRVLAILGSMFFLWLLVFEVLLRVLPIPAFERSELQPAFLSTQSSFNATGHPYQAFTPTPGWKSAPGKPHVRTHNVHGYRGPLVAKEKPADVYRIVCLGGSSTYGHTPSSDETTWPAQLQNYLNAEQSGKRVEVINGGFSGYSTHESLPNLAFRMIDYAPDLVIVYHTINDMRCALYGEPKGDNTHWRAVWPIYNPTPVERALEKSMTYLIFRRYFTSYISDMGDQGVWGIVGYDPDAEDMYAVDQRSPVGFRNFQRNLVSIQALASAHGAQTMFATQGCDRSDIGAESRDTQWAAMDEMERILRSVAGERKQPFVDGREALESTAAKEGRDVIFTNEVHLTDRGCEVLARAFADKILGDAMIK